MEMKEKPIRFPAKCLWHRRIKIRSLLSRGLMSDNSGSRSISGENISKQQQTLNYIEYLFQVEEKIGKKFKNTP